MVWCYNQMTVEQVCVQKKPCCHDNEQRQLYVVGNLQAGKQKLVNFKYSQISKNIKIKLYH